MKIQVLGMGCAKCNLLKENAETAARELGVEFEIEKVTDFGAIAKMGVLTTPALVVDGKVKLIGRAASPAEIKRLLEQA